MGALWTFVVEEGVEPTNNRVERALWFAVLWRRMLQGTYNAKGDRWVEQILSVRETCRLRGIPTFPVLVEAVICYFHMCPLKLLTLTYDDLRLHCRVFCAQGAGVSNRGADPRRRVDGASWGLCRYA